MPDPFFFLAFGGLGLSLAGFAGLIYFIDPRPEAQGAVATWRIRSIVQHGVAGSLAGLLTFPVFTWSQSVETTVRVVASFLLLFQLGYGSWALRPGPAWPGDQRRRVVIAISLVQAALLIANILTASVALLQFNILVVFADGAGAFMNAVEDISDSNDDADRQDQPPM